MWERGDVGWAGCAYMAEPEQWFSEERRVNGKDGNDNQNGSQVCLYGKAGSEWE